MSLIFAGILTVATMAATPDGEQPRELAAEAMRLFDKGDSFRAVEHVATPGTRAPHL